MVELTIKRSPARVTWWVMCNGQVVATKDTKASALEEKQRLERKCLR